MLEIDISKNKQIVIANLGPTWDCQIWILGGSDMDSGHVDGSISGPDAGCNLKIYTYIYIYKTCIKISKKNPIYIYIYIYPGMGGPYIS